MRLAAIFTLFVAFLLTGCQSTSQNLNKKIKFNQYQLVVLDNVVLTDPNIKLSFSDGLRVHGFTGCNRFFGQGKLSHNQFKIDELGMSRKRCDPQLTQQEELIIDTLSQMASLTVERDQLIIAGRHHLTFKRIASL
ncbi:META domain-containing protein [Pseudoalteromonas tunicata]|jgi:heat shock protein HslJ|uniref:Putative heat shock protein n=1 Tax=Pseudoalteromonas tunicata D2 TaxID=87626 RepID=A4C8K6_9GAMM|nr:META domain-containing protein [Pseudoalteromonas tunicata]ATC93425.1 heat shock protein HslJ [Pseudoalteromonas tunicata]AXT32467.1 META domain-containing protein [Pseudoalteromonas tunicata]EAR28921.1 putative heat shock protein [Pseudoalteromonas tunicata D2]MDP4983581.1 META domain-containing protein [Pseudoalteromonas tunicata]MDP5211698.1 META domain-containing protein [Pseudoalteromonas tunicata]